MYEVPFMTVNTVSGPRRLDWLIVIEGGEGRVLRKVHFMTVNTVSRPRLAMERELRKVHFVTANTVSGPRCLAWLIVMVGGGGRGEGMGWEQWPSGLPGVIGAWHEKCLKPTPPPVQVYRSNRHVCTAKTVTICYAKYYMKCQKFLWPQWFYAELKVQQLF